jgi:hypothetical protein
MPHFFTSNNRASLEFFPSAELPYNRGEGHSKKQGGGEYDQAHAYLYRRVSAGCRLPEFCATFSCGALEACE